MKIKPVISCLFISFLLLSLTGAKAQGSGKVFLKANIETSDDHKDLQVSVIDMVTRTVVQREDVSNRFFSSLATNGRYMLYFKKMGHPSARMIIDTHVETDDTYYMNLALNLKSTGPEMETGISFSAGTLKFDLTKSTFIIENPTASKAGLLTLTASGTGTGVAKF